jgi:hypothetical protein
LLHGHSISSLLPDVTKEAHFGAAICSGQTGSVAAFHVDAPSTAFGFAIRPSDFFGLELPEVGAPVHVARGTAVVSAVQPKIVQDPINKAFLKWLKLKTDQNT